VKVLTTPEVLDWFAAFPGHGIDYVQCGDGPHFAHPEASCIDIEYPSKLERLPFFARFLSTVGYESRDFAGALLWFRQWDVWNRSDEGVGYKIVEAMNRAAGQPSAFETGPGHLFRADEMPDTVAMLLQPMVFGWDAYYLPRWSFGTDEFFLFVSHDSFVSVVTRTKIFYERVCGLLESADLSPKPGHEMQLRRFCRV